MEDSIVSIIQSGLKYWVALLLMVPIAYFLSKKAYRAGDGWIKILGQDQFAKFGVAVLCLLIVLPFTSYIGAEVQQIIYDNLPSGKWLISLFGVGVLGVFLVLSDATKMNPDDGITRLILVGSSIFIAGPFIVHYVQRNLDLVQIWERKVVMPIMESIVYPIQDNIVIIALVCILLGYLYAKIKS